MTGDDDRMNRTRNLPRSEQLIGMLIPAVIPRPQPSPAPMPRLPASRPPRIDTLRVDAARVDPSGRICATSLLPDLGWNAGQMIDIGLHDPYLLVRTTAHGTVTVGVRGSIGLPAAQRQMCGIDIAATVILAADLSTAFLRIYPAAVVARLLAAGHASDECGRDGR